MNLEMESGDESGVGENYCGRCRESIWQRRSVLFVASGFMMNVFVLTYVMLQDFYIISCRTDFRNRVA